MRLIPPGIKRAILYTLLVPLLFARISAIAGSTGWLLPVSSTDRKAWQSVQLTRIGMFGLQRKARPGIPAHLHTGIDIKRPGQNWHAAPIYPVFEGKVISIRDDGPFAQIIIVHKMPGGGSVWTVYEHIAGITVSLDDIVSAHVPIARFMNKSELNNFGRQFNHLHLEILKHPPRLLEPTAQTPYRRYGTYSLECHTETELDRYYYNPIEFLKARWTER
jgi:murein DD-endopeptidase MepM/ murein hydrolase activator NlpD